MTKRWIQKAIRHPGSLTRKLHGSLGRTVVAATKRPVFTKSGEINTNTLRKFVHTQAYQRLPTNVKHQIQLAIRLESYSKRKKR